MADILIDLKEKLGAIKALHGVNNGPVCYGSLVDISHCYKDAGIPYVRLHDPNWPHPREVDIYTIFPNFDKDPQNPGNYDFRRTDTYIKDIICTGAKIVYRLGVSIEHTGRKYYTYPPKDFEKWAQICIGIIKHYNYGWANGFHYNIEYWEIWNEPDNPNGPCMWSGTPDQYFELYKTAAAAIKSFDPKLKVGGFAATMINHAFTNAFMEYCVKHKLPLDFFSWHTYTDSPAEMALNAKLVESTLSRYGYDKAESHLNEWNYFGGEWEKLFSKDSAQYKRYIFEKLKNEEGASFAAAVLIMLQDCYVDVANYYDGQPSSMFCGLFDIYGVPQKTYFAFKAFNELYRGVRQRVKVITAPYINGVYCCAGINEKGDESTVLISNFNSESREYGISFKGLVLNGNYICEAYVLDRDRNLELASCDKVNLSNPQLKKYIGRHSVALLKLKNQN